MIRCSNQIASRGESGALNLGTVPLTDTNLASARTLDLGKIGEVEVERGFIEASDHIDPSKKGINQVFLQSASWPD
jgi:hypothetical protein